MFSRSLNLSTFLGFIFEPRRREKASLLIKAQPLISNNKSPSVRERHEFFSVNQIFTVLEARECAACLLAACLNKFMLNLRNLESRDGRDKVGSGQGN